MTRLNKCITIGHRKSLYKQREHFFRFKLKCANLNKTNSTTNKLQEGKACVPFHFLQMISLSLMKYSY